MSGLKVNVSLKKKKKKRQHEAMVTDTCGQADGQTAGQSNKTRQRYRQGSYVAFGCMTATESLLS